MNLLGLALGDVLAVPCDYISLVLDKKSHAMGIVWVKYLACRSDDWKRSSRYSIGSMDLIDILA